MRRCSYGLRPRRDVRRRAIESSSPAATRRTAEAFACTCHARCSWHCPCCPRASGTKAADRPSAHAPIGDRDPAAPAEAAYARRLARDDRADPAAAADYDPADGLSLGEAEAVALLFNPELRLARLKADVPRLGAAEAGRWEDPELGFDAERILQSVRDPWVLAGTLSLTIPLSGRLGVEKRKANADATAGRLRALAEERRVLADLRAEWIEWSAIGERAALTRQHLADLKDIADRAERLRAAGELGPLDARLLRIESVKAAARLYGHEADARAAEVRLKARLGLAPSAGITLVPSLATPAAALPDDAALASALANHPRLRVARAEHDVAERSLELEVRKQYPDLRLGGGYGTDEGDDRVLMGAALPLPLLNANRRAIAEARAGRDVARAAAEAEYERLLAEAAAARLAVEGARARVDYVERELAPLADRPVADALRLGRAGDFDALVLLEALKTAHEAKLEVLDARLRAGLAGRLAGALFEGGAAAAPPPAEEGRP